MKKRIIALLLALVMVVGMLPTVALAADAPIQDEDGYYQLTNEADLKWFRDKVNAGEGTINARLMADVTLTESWTPIGVAADYVTSYDNKPFSGIFDGNEKTISGLNVTETAGNPAALFGMAKNATIKKLVVKGTVSSTAPSGGYMPVWRRRWTERRRCDAGRGCILRRCDHDQQHEQHRRDRRSGWQRLWHYDQELRELWQADCGGQRRGTYRRPERDFSVGRQGCN